MTMVLGENDSNEKSSSSVCPFTVLMVNGENCLVKTQNDNNNASTWPTAKSSQFCRHVTRRNSDVCTKENCPLLALNAVVPKHQVGGHMFIERKLGILQSESGQSLLKPIQSGQRGLREWAFYERIFSSNNQSNKLLFDFGPDSPEVSADLRKIIPKYKGYVRMPSVCYMELEDVTAGSRYPCVADAKLGVRTWEPSATPELIEAKKNRYPPLAQVGYQLVGMRAYLSDSTERYISKQLCRQMSAKSLVWRCWSLLFGCDRDNGCGRVRKGVVKQVLEQIEDIRSFAARQTAYRFISTSMLIYYDAKKFIESEDLLIEDEGAERVRVCLIDFVHVFPAENKQTDENFLNGIDGVIRDLNLLLNEPTAKLFPRSCYPNSE